MFEEEASWYVPYGGRSSGKSWEIAIRILQLMFAERHFVVCARETFTSIGSSSYKLMVDLIDMLGLTEYAKITRNTIEVPHTGSLAVFKGLSTSTGTDRGFRSLEGISLCWLEEAQYVSEESWRSARPTLNRSPNCKTFISFNPMFDTDPMWAEFVEEERPYSVVRKVNYSDNPFLPEAQLREIEIDRERLHPDLFDHIWEGGLAPTLENALWTREHLRDAAVDPADMPKRFDNVVMGLDPAAKSRTSSDYTAYAVVGTADGIAYIVESDQGHWTPDEWSRRCIDAYDRWGAHVLRYESNMGGEMVADVIRQRDDNRIVRLEEVRANAGEDKRSRAMPVQTAMTYHHQVKLPVGANKDLERQMIAFTGEAGKSAHDDLVDAMVWATLGALDIGVKRRAMMIAGFEE